MAHIREDLSNRIHSLEKEVQSVLEEKERAFRYRLERGKAKFEEDILPEHRKLKLGLLAYLRQSRLMAIVTAPVIYVGIVPFALLDLFLAAFQGICFPVYGIPKVDRSDYLVFDRGHLKYMNLLERLNCVYCSYANGLLAHATEIAARTEQHWCPVKHARRIRAPHSRYPHFIDYGDAQRFRDKSETVRSDFVDIRNVAERQKKPNDGLNPCAVNGGGAKVRRAGSHETTMLGSLAGAQHQSDCSEW